MSKALTGSTTGVAAEHPVPSCNSCVQQPDYSHLSDLRFHTKYPTSLFFILHEYLAHMKPERITKPWTSLLESYRHKVGNTDRCLCGLGKQRVETLYIYTHTHIHAHMYVHTHQHTDKAMENTSALMIRSTLGEYQAHKQWRARVPWIPSNSWEHINILNNFRWAGALSNSERASDLINHIFADSYSAKLTRQAFNAQNITVYS